ncbi:hypothetical protein QQG55_47175 [Brugia pahangi]
MLFFFNSFFIKSTHHTRCSLGYHFFLIKLAPISSSLPSSSFYAGSSISLNSSPCLCLATTINISIVRYITTLLMSSIICMHIYNLPSL